MHLGELKTQKELVHAEMNKDTHLIYEAYLNESITRAPAGGWKLSPEMEKWIDNKYSQVYGSWEPVKRALLTGEIPDYTVFKGAPMERKMTLMDIVPSRKGEPKTLVDWIRTNIKEVIVTAGGWVDNNVENNSRLIFDPRQYEHSGTQAGIQPIGKELYQDALSQFRKRLVGFGNNPQTMWHILDSQNAREVLPVMERSIDDLFDLTREIIHYNRPRTSDDN